ncbi:MAG: hypothetical protein DRP42_05790, partial [Tenericutes bacterium]
VDAIEQKEDGEIRSRIYSASGSCKHAIRPIRLKNCHILVMRQHRRRHGDHGGKRRFVTMTVREVVKALIRAYSSTEIFF